MASMGIRVQIWPGSACTSTMVWMRRLVPLALCLTLFALLVACLLLLAEEQLDGVADLRVERIG